MQNSFPNHQPGCRRMRLVGYLLGFSLGAVVSPSFAADASTSCCNEIERRRYSLRPGRLEAFIQLLDSTFADPLDATGIRTHTKALRRAQRSDQNNSPRVAFQ